MVAANTRSRKATKAAAPRKAAIARSTSASGRPSLSRRASVKNFGKTVISQKVIPNSDQDDDEDEDNDNGNDEEGDQLSDDDSESSELSELDISDASPLEVTDDDDEEEEESEKEVLSLATSRALGQVAKKRRITETPAKPIETPVSKVIKSHSRVVSTRSSAKSSKASSVNGFDSFGPEDTPATSVASSTAFSPASNGKLRARRAIAPSPATTKKISKIKIEDSEGEDEDMLSDDDNASNFSSELSSALSDVSALNSEAEDAEDNNSDDDDDSDDAGPSTRPAASRRKAPTTSKSAKFAHLQRDRRFRGMTNRAIREKHELWAQHPYLKTIWEDLDKYEKIPVEKAPQPPGLNLKMLSFQLEGINWLYKQERTKFNGGILADEMGMGKTIQTIGLLMMEPREKPNLVVAPTVAVMQWRSEIEKFTDGGLSVFVFHGKERLTPAELKKHDVVLTTYNQLESVFRKQEWGFKRKAGLVKEKSALHGVQWHRVILDEAHNIKDRQCNTAKAVFGLKTKFKLCLSGTPLQNRIGELFSLLRFLETDPFSYYFCRKCDCKAMHWKFSDYKSCDTCKHRPMDHVCWFNNELLKPIQRNGNELIGKDAFANLQKLLGCIMLRRTKVERADDLGLPPRVVRVRRDKFSPEELDLYDGLYGDSKRKFNTFVATGVVLNNYANIFTLITRMRQLADHPDLVFRSKTAGGEANDLPNNLVCALCDEEAEEAIKSKCHHTFCRMCVTKYIETYDGSGEPDCPTCHITLNIDLSQPAMEVDPEVHKKGSILNRINLYDWRSSTKIEALCEELYKLRSRSHTIKSIVFSQFTSMLQLVEWRLKKAGFKTVMLEGSMSPQQREKTIDFFMNNVSVEVFLVSLKAGGVALNLTEASQVFILDPWWNPSVEWQSGDRIHRIGQTRPCRITRLVIENSIESRIIELQEKKANMINATVGNDQAALEKLSPADLQFLFQN